MDTFTFILVIDITSSGCYMSESSIYFQWEVININLAKPYIDAWKNFLAEVMKRCETWVPNKIADSHSLTKKNKMSIFLILLYCQPRIKAGRWMK